MSANASQRQTRSRSKRPGGASLGAGGPRAKRQRGQAEATPSSSNSTSPPPSDGSDFESDVEVPEPDGMGPGSIYNPAAGTYQQDLDVNARIPSNLGRQPLGLTTGVAAPPRFTIQPKPVQVSQESEELETSETLQQKTPPGTAKRGPPTTDPTPKAGHKRARRTLNKGNWSFPDHRYNKDETIIQEWKYLEQMIASYVRDALVTHIPDIDTTHDHFPYEAICRHSDLAGAIVRSPLYAKYIFQLSIWNILNKKYLGHMATEWACEERGSSWTNQKTRGLAETVFRLTWEPSIDRKPIIAQHEREKFFLWRRDTVDIAFGWLCEDDTYETNVENAVFDILWLYQGYHVKPWTDGNRHDWDTLVYRTTEIVAMAAELSIKMRRCKDGTWSPFIPVRGNTVAPTAVMPHHDRDLSMPKGQTAMRADSKITMCVVPGLCKYQMTKWDADPEQPEVVMTKIVKMVRMKAECLIDITEKEVGPMLDGDIWIPDDL